MPPKTSVRCKGYCVYSFWYHDSVCSHCWCDFFSSFLHRPTVTPKYFCHGKQQKTWSTNTVPGPVYWGTWVRWDTIGCIYTRRPAWSIYAAILPEEPKSTSSNFLKHDSWTSTLRLCTAGKCHIVKALFCDKAKEEEDNVVKKQLTWYTLLNYGLVYKSQTHNIALNSLKLFLMVRSLVCSELIAQGSCSISSS